MEVDLYMEIPKMTIFLVQKGGSTYTRQNTVHEGNLRTSNVSLKWAFNTTFLITMSKFQV